MSTRGRRLVALGAVAAVAFPAGAFAAAKGIELPAWMWRMMDDAPPAMQQHMRSPEMEPMMESPSPEMRRMMETPPAEMQRMMETPRR